MQTGWFDAFVIAVGICAGAIASVTGFGIGSLLTPTLGLQVGAKIAVAAVSIPHLVGTALRFSLSRGAQVLASLNHPHIDLTHAARSKQRDDFEGAEERSDGVRRFSRFVKTT